MSFEATAELNKPSTPAGEDKAELPGRGPEVAFRSGESGRGPSRPVKSRPFPELLSVILAIGFAYSMGAHYTGACMGMPHALSAISARRALLVMAPLTLIGATFASQGVEQTVGS